MWHCIANYIKQCINMRDDLIHLQILTGEFGIGEYSFEITFPRGVLGPLDHQFPKGFRESHKAKPPPPH